MTKFYVKDFFPSSTDKIYVQISCQKYIGFWFLVFGFWFLAVGCWLLIKANYCQLLTTNINGRAQGKLKTEN